MVRRAAWIVAVVVALGASRGAAADPQPGAIVVVVDRSMPPEKLEVVTRSLIDALGSFSPGDQLAVVAFARTARVQVPLQPARASAKLAAQLNQISYAEGGSLLVGLRSAFDVLAGSKRKVKHVFVITEREGLDGARPFVGKMHAAGILTSAIGYQSLNQRALDDVAATGGGKAYVIADAPALGKVVASWRSGVAREEPPVAIVFVIDRSGSMHGDKLEAAKELVRTTLEALAPTDYIAVVAFDSEAMVLVRPQRVANRMRIAADLARLDTGGGTNIFPGLKEAYEILLGINATAKQVIVLTDGEANADGIVELVQDMRAARITVSAVGMSGADRTLLSRIADAGDGQLYMTDDLRALPTLFARPAPPN